MIRWLLAALLSIAAPGCSGTLQGQAVRTTHEKIDAAFEAAHVHVEPPIRALVVDYPELARELERAHTIVPEAVPMWRGDTDDVRVEAAYQGARYAIVRDARFTHDEGWSPLRLLYLGLVTMFFVPGETLETHGTVAAALIEVHGGAILARVSESVEESSWFIRVGRTPSARAAHEREIRARAAGRLAEKLDLALRRHVADHRSCPYDIGAASRRPGFFEDRP